MKIRRSFAVVLTALALALSLIGGVTASASDRDRDGSNAGFTAPASLSAVAPVALPSSTLVVQAGTGPTGPDARS